MNGNTQWTRSGQERENAILQGLLASGVPLDQAQQIAAQNAGPSDETEATGRAIGWLLWLMAGAFALIVLAALLGLHAPSDNCGDPDSGCGTSTESPAP